MLFVSFKNMEDFNCFVCFSSLNEDHFPFLAVMVLWSLISFLFHTSKLWIRYWNTSLVYQSAVLEIDFILSPHSSVYYYIQQRVLNNSGGHCSQFHFFGNRVKYHSSDCKNTTKKHKPRKWRRKLMQGKAKIKFHFLLFTLLYRSEVSKIFYK